MHDCDRVKLKTLSRKFDKWECIWCGQKQTVKKGQPPEDKCARTYVPRPSPPPSDVV